MLKRSQYLHKDQSGFTLLSLLVSVAIMSFSMVQLSKMLSQQNKSQSQMRSTIDLDAYVNRLALVMSNPTVCASYLATRKFNPSPELIEVQEIPNSQDSNEIMLGVPESPNGILANVGMLITPHLKISNLSIKNFIALTPHNYLAQLHINTHLSGGIDLGRNFPIVLTTQNISEAEEEVIGCYSNIRNLASTQSEGSGNASADESGLGQVLRASLVTGLMPTYLNGDEVLLTRGAIYSDDNTELIELQTDVSISRLTHGVNGVSSDSPVSPNADTWYAIWVMKNSATGEGAALLSISPQSPELPNGYQAKRRVGWIHYNRVTSSKKYFSSFMVLSPHLPRLFLSEKLSSISNPSSSGLTYNLNKMVPLGINRILARLEVHCSDSTGGSEIPSLTAYVSSLIKVGIYIKQECNGGEGQLNSTTEPLAVSLSDTGDREVYLRGHDEGSQNFQVKGWYDSLE